jgi:hypothetical protein
MVALIIDPDFGLDAPELGGAPATPAANRRRLYPKSDGWYDKDDGGNETKLVSGTVDHGALGGLGDDDHTQYAEVADAETVTGLWTFDRDPGAPFAVAASSAKVDNLDADLLDGQQASDFAADDHNHATNGVRTKLSTADVSNPPTDAELDSAFGTPATVGSGFMAQADDGGTDTTMWLVGSNGTSWWYVQMTKAT